ncbi:DUF3189 family protein [Tepidanaerobacter acetatoxydans]|uniref:DUF3189 family protein n=1 Tax=Tepidanaerobacter acetatoxydans TaxID=499229 RepID=UPI001BD5F63E|nr:DUF3189 family protein [Tepidanaerobacter acetatoxydans]
MKVIYSCYWGSYLAVVAASLHLELIDVNKYNKNDILSLRLFNKISDMELGELFFIGMDDKKSEIYVMGSKNSGKILEKALKGVAEIYGFGKDSVILIDLNPYYNILLSLGILLIKRLGLIKTGMKLVLKGIAKNYDKIIKKVQCVKAEPIYEGNKQEVNR